MDKHDIPHTSYSKRQKIVVVMHSVINLKFFWVPILEAMSKEFEVVLYVRNDVPEIMANLNLPCPIVFIPIERKIMLWKDLRAMFAIYKQLRRDRPDLLQTVTPKAGLLGMMAGWVARVPVRVHTFQGQVWATTNGLKRMLFRFVDRFIVTLSTNVLADSHTQIDFLRHEGVLGAGEGQVLGAGSISGVNLDRFNRYMEPDLTLRADLGIGEDEFIFLYLGRLQGDKGLHVLADAYAEVLGRSTQPTRLLVVGPDEDNLGPMLKDKLGNSVVLRPYSDRPEAYMRLANITVLPSFREGFGSVLIEAAAMGIPAVASRIYGIDCAVVDGETGLLFEAGNAAEMAAAMMRLIEDSAEYKRLSANAIARTARDFDQRIVVANLVDYYRNTLNNRSVQK